VSFHACYYYIFHGLFHEVPAYLSVNHHLNKPFKTFSGGATLSGQNDSDYPSLGNLSAGLANLKLLKTGNKTPLPREVMEHFGSIL